MKINELNKYNVDIRYAADISLNGDLPSHSYKPESLEQYYDDILPLFSQEDDVDISIIESFLKNKYPYITRISLSAP